jgi:glycosyltransferase involved in cell wall biosynthesis
MSHEGGGSILMVLDGAFPPDIRVEKEAGSLLKAGHKVTVACITFENESPLESYRGVNVIRAKAPRYYKKFRAAALTIPFFHFFWNHFLGQMLEKEDFDIIHIHDLILAKPGIRAAKRKGIPFLVDFHENYPYMLEEEPYSKGFLGRLLLPIPLWKRHECRMMEQIPFFIAVVKEMRDRLLVFNPVSQGVVVENTLNQEDWPKPILSLQNKTKTDELRLVFVGGISPMRGLEIAIKGLKIANSLPNTSFRFSLDIYGDGKPEYLQFLNNLIRSLGIDDHVFLKGRINLPPEGNALEQYDIGVIPHLKSIQTDFSSPNKIYQYLYYGLPVLSSNCLSLSRIIQESGTGAVYQHDDPNDFAIHLQLLANRIVEEPTLRERAHKAVIEHYTWDSSERALLSLYEKILTK